HLSRFALAHNRRDVRRLEARSGPPLRRGRRVRPHLRAGNRRGRAMSFPSARADAADHAKDWRVAAVRGWVRPSVLPGFGLTMGFSVAFLSAIVLIPIAALVLKAGSMPLAELWAT